MTRDELDFQSNRIIAAAKASLELQSEFSPTFMVHRPDKGWQSAGMPAGTEHILNSGKFKQRLFDWFREFVRRNCCDGIIFATDTWAGTVTKEGAQHWDTPEWKELQDFGFEKLTQRGWVTRTEAITLTAQSPTDALVIRQVYQRDGGVIRLLNCDRRWFLQSEFAGRQKMFGDLSQGNLGD